MDDLMGQSRPNHARITMSTPERPPISGLVEIAVTFDPSRPRGVAVAISGAMGVDVDVDARMRRKRPREIRVLRTRVADESREEAEVLQVRFVSPVARIN